MNRGPGNGEASHIVQREEAKARRVLRTSQARSRRLCCRRGLTLIETMISLSITVTLLVAVAAAFTASASAVQVNADFFRATQAARISVNQMLNQIRQADSVAVPSSAEVDVTLPLQLQQPNENTRAFVWDSLHQRLTLQILYNDGATSPLYELASSISSATFGPARTGTDWNNDPNVVQKVPVSVTVTVGQNAITLNGAGGPRRAQAN